MELIEIVKLIVAEIDNVEEKEFIEPVAEIDLANGDQIAGSASFPLRKLFTVYKRTEKSRDLLGIEYKNMSREDKDENLGKLMEFNFRVTMLNLWIAYYMQEEYKLWNKPKIGLTQGFQVIYNDQAPMLGGLFGPFKMEF